MVSVKVVLQFGGLLWSAFLRKSVRGMIEVCVPWL